MSEFPTAGASAGNQEVATPAAFRFRRGTLADLSHCMEILPAGFKAPAHIRERMVDVWSQLIDREAKAFAIVEDIERPYPTNIEGFGLSAFVSDRFWGDFCSSPKPHLATIFYERLLAGDDVVLTAEQLRRRNSAGSLNLVVLHYGLRGEDFLSLRTTQTLAAASASFYFFHAGYRINAILNEVFGPHQAQYMELGGFKLVKDFGKESPADFSHLPSAQHPYLFELRRDWVLPGVLDTLSHLLRSPLPRLHFSASERQLLEGSLLHQSDVEIAASLGISIDTVKKKWRSIYSRAGRGIQQLIPGDNLSLSGSRGHEKRRYILDYVRTHLEELRPSDMVPTNGWKNGH